MAASMTTSTAAVANHGQKRSFSLSMFHALPLVHALSRQREHSLICPINAQTSVLQLKRRLGLNAVIQRRIDTARRRNTLMESSDTPFGIRNSECADVRARFVKPPVQKILLLGSGFAVCCDK